LPPAEWKGQPEDFRVDEQLSFEPSGSGAHFLLRVEKRGANTQWVAAELGRLGGIPVATIGYAGLKDRQAQSVQWFSVPKQGNTADHWREVHTAEFTVLEVQGNARKLQRGALSGNRFCIRLRGAAWSHDDLQSKLAAVRAHGVPNYRAARDLRAIRAAHPAAARRVVARAARSCPQQHVHRSRAAVEGARRGECHDVEVPAQPQIDGDFQDGTARTGSISLAVNHPHAPPSKGAAVREKLRKPIARRRLVQAVQVDLVLDRDESAPQSPDDLRAHTGTVK